jgi:hypothetical protein
MFVATGEFCDWLHEVVFSGGAYSLVNYFAREITYLSFNIQNNLYLSAGNTRIIHEVLFHNVNIGVWCALNETRIIGSIFSSDTTNPGTYSENISLFFFNSV